MVEPQNLLEKGYQTLYNLLQKEQRQRKMLIVLAFVSGIGTILASQKVENAKAAGLVTGFGLIFLLLGLRMLRDWWRVRDIWREPLLQTLEQAPESFVWIYTTKVRAETWFRVREYGYFVCRMHDRRIFEMRGSFEEVDILLRYFQLLIPQATFGYTKERAQWYLANPLLLWNGSFEVEGE